MKDFIKIVSITIISTIILFAILLAIMRFGSYEKTYGATIYPIDVSQTFGTFVDNVSSSIDSLNTQLNTVSSTLDTLSLSALTSVGGSNTHVQYNSGGLLGGDSGLTYTSSTKALVIGGTLSTDGRATQSVTTATATISSTGTYIAITPDADYLMSSTPTIATSTNSQWLIIHNESATSSITLQDNSALAGSAVVIAGANPTLAPSELMVLFYDSNDGLWHIISHPNNPTNTVAAVGVIPVRNTSGSTISAGSPVYITGYNTGLDRVTIGLADADDSAKYPAIGLTSGNIPNNSNGTVIVSGVIDNLDTSGYSVNDPMYLGITAGTVTSTRPTGASTCIQTVARVARSNASVGVVQVIGAGRCNDVPNQIDFSVTSVSTPSGFLKADGSGVVTTSTVDISDNTNLVAGSNLYLSDDTISATTTPSFTSLSVNSKTVRGEYAIAATVRRATTTEAFGNVPIEYASTITGFRCNTTDLAGSGAGSNVILGADIRASSTPSTHGTNIFNGGIATCDSDQYTTSTFANASVSAGQLISIYATSTLSNSTTTVSFTFLLSND